MPDWKHIVARYHAAAHSDDEHALVTGDGALASEIEKTGDELGIKFPNEFASLYGTYDGIGVGSDDDDIWWLFRPLDQLSQFANTIRESFSETHPETAERFFPFLDWANGDGMGYLMNESGEVLPGLYTFEHESFEFDEDQETEEFLSSIPVTIEEFLNSV